MGDEPFFFNPLAPEMAVDPYPQYHELRRRDPVHLWPLGFWFLTRHADVVAFFADRTLEHRYVRTQTQRLGERVLAEPYFELFSHMVFVLDNPDHRRLLGIPDEDHTRIAEWVHALNPVLEFLPMSDDVLAKANEATGVLAEYFNDLAVKRRSDPHDDLFSAMVHAEEEGERLSEIELVANAILLYLAGHETSAGGTGLAVLALHRNPDQLALLQSDPDLVSNAVRELLRYDTPGQATARVTTVPTTFGGVEIPEAQVVVAWIGAANRDPEAFPDPDRLDLRRPVDRDLMSFGGGAHYCIGHALARHELEVALATLLRRCPELCLETLDPPFRETSLMRGVLALPVTW